MAVKRKILPVIKKVTFAEAENADDQYWANAGVEERLQELINIRKMFFGDVTVKIQKIVSRRSMYEEEN